MVTPYTEDRYPLLFIFHSFIHSFIQREFHEWVRQFFALPFIDLNNVRAQFNRLTQYEFNKDSPWHRKIVDFVETFASYFNDTWIDGSK